jgi:hypothetical protein
MVPKVPTALAPGEYPAAPAGLSASQAQKWDAIVHTKPSDWFSEDSFPVLIAYIRAIEVHEKFSTQVEGFDEKKLKSKSGLSRFVALSAAQEKQARLLATLAAKMRLTQQSRYTPKSSATAANKVGSGKKPWEA